jgi:hypothetical protein
MGYGELWGRLYRLCAIGYWLLAGGEGRFINPKEKRPCPV